MVTKHLRIHGRVQGVCYRAWTVEKAQSLGITGWVRNRGDGSVEALITGPEDMVGEMIASCRTGPTAAQVSGIDIKDAESENTDGFEFRSTV